MKRMRFLFFVILVGVAILYIYNNASWILRKGLVTITGIKLASEYYVFELNNSSGKPLIVNVENLNDQKWELVSSRERHARDQLGLLCVKELKLQPGQRELVVLPSMKYSSLGIISVFARSDWETFPMVSQEVAMILVSQSAVSGVHPDFADTDTRYPVVEIGNSDLQRITEEDLMRFDNKKVLLVDAADAQQ